jgi:NADPH-dependent 2,4-dienoyl-CoA reductase/sulfur reductase-like enzyme
MFRYRSNARSLSFSKKISKFTRSYGVFPSSELRSAEIVVVGGGAIGCAVAYSLANAGKTNVIVLEKEPSLSSVTR